MVVAAVLSGNRNFEGRINPLVKANYLASPPLVVAYALAGTVDIDLATDPLGVGLRRQAGLPARHLADHRRNAGRRSARPSMPRCSARNTRRHSKATPTGSHLPGPDRRAFTHGTTTSTYIKKPPYFDQMMRSRKPDRRSDRPARAGAAGRFGHHRSHLARRQHRRKTARRAST